MTKPSFTEQLIEAEEKNRRLRVDLERAWERIKIMELVIKKLAEGTK